VTAEDIKMIVATAPDRDAAVSIARTLVEERGVACANILPAVSIYRWEGEVQQDEEVVVLMKTRGSMVQKVVDRVSELHPYEVPEVLALPVEGGLDTYCQWVSDETGEKAE